MLMLPLCVLRGRRRLTRLIKYGERMATLVVDAGQWRWRFRTVPAEAVGTVAVIYHPSSSHNWGEAVKASAVSAVTIGISRPPCGGGCMVDAELEGFRGHMPDDYCLEEEGDAFSKMRSSTRPGTGVSLRVTSLRGAERATRCQD